MRKLNDIITRIFNDELEYKEAIDEVRAVEADKETIEKYVEYVNRLFEINHAEQLQNEYQISGIPNELYYVIFKKVLSSLREGVTADEIVVDLYSRYRISTTLIQYFINEASHVVRMNSITTEELNQIIASFYKANQILKERNRKEKETKEDDI